MAWPFFPTPFLGLLSCPVLPSFFPFHSYRILDLSPQGIIIVVSPGTLVFLFRILLYFPWSLLDNLDSLFPLKFSESTPWGCEMWVCGLIPTEWLLMIRCLCPTPGPPTTQQNRLFFPCGHAGATSPEQLLNNSVIHMAASVSCSLPNGAGCSRYLTRPETVPPLGPWGWLLGVSSPPGRCEFRERDLSCLGASCLGRTLKVGEGVWAVCSAVDGDLTLARLCPWSSASPVPVYQMGFSLIVLLRSPFGALAYHCFVSFFFSYQVAFRRVWGPVIISSAALSFFGRQT